MKEMEQQIENVIRSLEKNNFSAFFVSNKADALQKALSFIKEGDIISCGGSVTLKEIGLLEELRQGKNTFLDRAKKDICPEEKSKVHRDSFFADLYFSGTNAITEDGILYNVDGHANRIAAIAFGPKKVVIIVGINKIVKNIDDAIDRVRKDACGKNATRLKMDTPCEKIQKCVTSSTEFSAGCKHGDRMCCQHLISAFQKDKNRINIIICAESLGC